MKGIILAGGSGTRLHPITKAISKQILPVYDKPMIYYPLSVLMLTDIREVLIISTPRDLPIFQELLGDGSWLGMKFEYQVQDKPRGIADAFIVGSEFLSGSACALILGDNVFYGRGFSATLKGTRERIEKTGGAGILSCYVKDPSAYGVVEFDADNKIISLEEKPTYPKSHYAVTGLYFYDSMVVDVAKNVQPSSRGEKEITAVNNEYLKNEKLFMDILGRGMTWFDTGNCDSLLEASNFIEAIQKRQGMFISCPEEIAYNKGWINREALLILAKECMADYGDYLRTIAMSV